jgi:PKD repeat protein
MNIFKTLLAGIFCFAVPAILHSQDFSNKGKDFWIGYGNHVRMLNGGVSDKMQLYITSDQNTSGVVTIASLGFTQNFTVTANQITTIDIPDGASLTDQGLYNHGIHVTTLKPVVVYSFIYVNAISGATVCLPTNTLGRDYYSVNFKQLSNEQNSHSYFFVIATDTGSTTVEITPSAITKLGQPAGVPFTVTLTQGQIYQVLGQVTGTQGVDLTGSKIRSISTGTGCKKIGVFCGSGKISIGCSDPGVGSSDNLYQQIYPTGVWGKTYITVPSTNNGSNFQNNIYRIIRPDPLSVVTLNGVVIPAASFTNNFYYQFTSNTTNIITSDLPILVAQYFPTTGGSSPTNCGNSGIGDPEMIYLNPVEQTISNVTLNSMQPSINTNLTTHFLNVVLRNVSGAINSFKIDGASYSSNFTPVLQDPNYAYARISVASQGHTVTCDSGFNVIAYGFGNAESYGYSGGTNLKDLYQFVSIANQYATVNFPATCRNTPFYFRTVFPYQPTQIQWVFGAALNAMGIADVTIASPVFDSTWVVNGRQVYRYSLPTPYIINAVGTYPIKIIANNPTPDGCSGVQEIDYDLQVFNPPSAGFYFNTNGCVTAPVNFFDTSNTGGRTIIQWNWNFGDATTSSIQNPSHTYAAPGSYLAKLAVITDVGCISDTATRQVNLTQLPLAKFGATLPRCAGKPITFTDSSTVSGGATLVKWFWDFGDGSPVVTATSNAPQVHTYTAAGSYNATLKVETSTGCQSLVIQGLYPFMQIQRLHLT